jgi:hypothetical protein
VPNGSLRIIEGSPGVYTYQGASGKHSSSQMRLS